VSTCGTVAIDILNRANDFERIIRDVADEVEVELNDVCGT